MAGVTRGMVGLITLLPARVCVAVYCSLFASHNLHAMGYITVLLYYNACVYGLTFHSFHAHATPVTHLPAPRHCTEGAFHCNCDVHMYTRHAVCVCLNVE